MPALRLSIVASLLFLAPAAGHAVDVNVIGLFPGKAVVTVDGGPIRTLSVGQRTTEGVVLLSTDRESATFEIGGKKKILSLGQHRASPAASSSQSVTLTADPRGHFVVEGQVNGGAVRFLVDTGRNHHRALFRRRQPARDRLSQGTAGPGRDGERHGGGLSGQARHRAGWRHRRQQRGRRGTGRQSAYRLARHELPQPHGHEARRADDGADQAVLTPHNEPSEPREDPGSYQLFLVLSRSMRA